MPRFGPQAFIELERTQCPRTLDAVRAVVDAQWPVIQFLWPGKGVDLRKDVFAAMCMQCIGMMPGAAQQQPQQQGE